MTVSFPAVRAVLLAAGALALAGCVGTGVTFPNVKEADVATVRGTLALPEGRGPFPAVVLVHGCSGIRPNADVWVRFLRSHGYASLVLDGFGPRGVTEICTDFGRVPPFRRVGDAYAALRYLAARPEIAGDRVALMGFSNGGVVVLDAANSLWVERGPEVPHRFRGSIALYPECRNRMAVYRIPVLILIGERDDWTLAASCQELVRDLNTDSSPVDLRIYPNALHAFDDLYAGAYLPRVRNMNSPTGYGASVGGDARALDRAQADVLAFLRRHLAPT
jgi:dienelactone hydrolase